jgi:hypothetical protein
MLYAFDWVIPRLRYDEFLYTYPPIKMEQTERPDTLAFKLQTLGGIIQKKAYKICYVARIRCPVLAVGMETVPKEQQDVLFTS